MRALTRDFGDGGVRTVSLCRTLIFTGICLFSGWVNAYGDALGEAVDRAEWVWQSGGNASWSAVTDVWYSGGASARSGVIGNSQSSWIETSVTVSTPMEISFYWKVSSEGPDRLRFLADGVERFNISGTVDWQQRSYAMNAGTHTFRWLYNKDGSVASGPDCGWLDKVELRLAPILVGGTLTTDTAWNLPGRTYRITSAIIVPAGITLTIGPDVIVSQDASGFAPLTVSGTVDATATTFSLQTYADYSSPRNGITLNSGANATFRRCILRSTEVSSYWQSYWASLISASAGARVSLFGCSLESVAAARTGYGVSIAGTAEAAIADDTPSGTRCSFKGFLSGIGWRMGSASQSVAFSTFANCDRNLYMDGTLTDDLTLPYDKQYLRGNLTIPADVTLTLPPGSEIVSDNTGRSLIVADAGFLVANSARLNLTGPLNVAGFATLTGCSVAMGQAISMTGTFDATGTTFTLQTYASYSPRHGIVLNGGAMASFTRCRFLSTEGSYYDCTFADDFSALSRQISAANGTLLSLLGCSLESVAQANHYRTGFGVFASPTTELTIGSDTSQGAPIPCSFKGVRFGVYWAFGNVPQTVERCLFEGCQENVWVSGGVARHPELRPTGVPFQQPLWDRLARDNELPPGR